MCVGVGQPAYPKIEGAENLARSFAGEDFFPTLQPLSKRSTFASLSLFDGYFHGKCLNEPHSLIPPFRFLYLRLGRVQLRNRLIHIRQPYYNSK